MRLYLGNRMSQYFLAASNNKEASGSFEDYVHNVACKYVCRRERPLKTEMVNATLKWFFDSGFSPDIAVGFLSSPKGQRLLAKQP